MTVPVNKIIPFSVVDGPGNRTSIFLQKCNIHCGYCHNPETQRMCVDCGICVKGCPAGALAYREGKVCWDSEKCVQCDQCIAVCPNYATPKIRWMNAKEVFDEVRRSIPFIRGITVSGGECMLYPEFLEELFSLAHKESLSCLIDSNGMVPFEEHKKLTGLCDGVMLDVKSWEEETYRRLTGASNENVKANLRYLSEMDKLEEIRIVCLPGMVAAERTIDGVRKTIKEKARTVRLKLITFRSFGVRGAFAKCEAPEMAYMETLRKRAEENGFGNILVV